MNHERFEGLSRTLAGASSRRQALKLFGGAAAGGFVLATGRKGVAAQTAIDTLVGIPVTGTLSRNRTFTGTLDIVRFVVEGGQLVAVGELSGTVTNAGGRVLQTITDAIVRIPVTDLAQGATCEILDLTLGPLDLNLLGLRIQLSQIDLRITAESGPGNLLGNLLCQIAGLLDGGSLTTLARLLNRVLGLLG